MVDGKARDFGAIGLTNGLAVLGDRETRTHWDHITGEAFKGKLAGARLDVWPVQMTTVAAALAEDPGIIALPSPFRTFRWWLAQKLYPRFIHGRVWLPAPFYLSMAAPIDARLDRLAQGLGVVAGKKAKYYPMRAIPVGGLDDNWHGRILHVECGALDGVPRASWADTGERPMQLLSRWYGFSFTYPGCEVYEK